MTARSHILPRIFVAKVRRHIGLTSAICGTLAAASAGLAPANAQDQAPQSSEFQTADIVVTAQRRSQRLQDVPLSVVAVGQEALKSAAIDNAAELARIDPSVNITTSNGAVQPFFRGVGNPSGGFLGNESSVPVYIDGVYYARLSPPYLDLANVERVELLKGPQGTLFGRNASGGLMQIITRDPGDKLTGEATAGYANYNTFSGKIYISSPLAEGVGADIAISGLHQADGWGTNLPTGTGNGKNKYITARSKLVIEPTDSTKIKLIGYYIRSNSSQGVYLGVHAPYFSTTPSFYGPVQIATPPGLGYYDSIDTEQMHITYKGYGGSAQIDQEAGFADFTSITAYQHSREVYTAENDYVPLNYGLPILYGLNRQFSQELQMKSKSASQVAWLVGLYYLNLKQGYTPLDLTGDLLDFLGGPGASLGIYGLQTTKSYSGYGQATFKVLPDGTNITLGLRYTSDKVTGSGRQDLVTGGGTFPAQPLFTASRTFSKLTYKVAVDHHFGRDVLGYVSFSRGFKSGAFNTIPLNAVPARPEVVQAYEIGLKGSAFDRRLTFSAAAFLNDITDPQVAVQLVDPNTGVNNVGLSNAGKARTRGFEFDSSLAITPELTARLGGTYIDAKYLRYQNAPFLVAPTGLPQNGGLCPALDPNDPAVPATEGALCAAVPRDASGHRMAQVPKWRFVGGLNYAIDTSAGRLILDANASYTSQFFWDPDNIASQKGYVLTNGSVEFRPTALESVSVRLWMKNITDKKYHIGVTSTAGSIGRIDIPGAPRTFGADVSYRF